MRQPRPQPALIALALSFALTLALAADPRALGQDPVEPARAVLAQAKRAVPVPAPAAVAGPALELRWVLEKDGGNAAAAPTSRPADGPSTGIGPYLQLADGGFVAGSLVDSDKPGVLRFQGGQFTAPFAFPLAAVGGVHAPAPKPAPRAVGAYRFELQGGDTLFGSLAALDEKAAELDVAGLGRLHADRAAIRRIDRWRDGADILYLGPSGLPSWTPHVGEAPRPVATPAAGPQAQANAGMRVVGGVVMPNAAAQPARNAAFVAPAPAPRSNWREESGELVSDRDGAPIQADVTLPAQAVVEVELSWKDRPDFLLALGAGPDADSLREAFRIEVWDKAIVAAREVDDDADFAAVGKAVPGKGRLHLRAYLDQEAGRLIVVSGAGEPLADFTVQGPKGRTFGGLVLANKAGDLRVERLRVSRWDGHPPRAGKPGESDPGSLERVDGRPVKGRVARYDAGAKAFVVAEGDAETKVPEDEVSALALTPPAAATPDDPAKAPRVRVTLQDGTRVAGALAKVEGGHVILEAPGVKEPLRLPVASLTSLAVLARVAPDKEASTAGAEGKPAVVEAKAEKGLARLVAEGVNLLGRLDDAKAADDASCLAWKAAGSDVASPLRPGVAGRIFFKDRAVNMPVAWNTGEDTLTLNGNVQIFQQNRVAALQARQVVIQRQVLNGQVVIMNGQPMNGGVNPGVNGFVRGFATKEAPASGGGFTRSLFLRTGDVIPADVVKIDESGVTFRSAVSSSTFVPNDKVKAVELAPETSTPIRLNRPKRDRLLTLPRAQQGSPPTQLIRSKNGDYLRGRVVAMDARTLQVESKLDTRAIPRDRISRIIWVHPDEVDPARPPEAPKEKPARAAAGSPSRVQAVRSDGVRFTFTPEAVEAGVISGKSDVLGACKVALASLDELILGPMIEHEATTLAYQQWRLRNAEEPKVYQDEGGAGGDGEDRLAGTRAPLVGKEAPPFELDLLDGKKFTLGSLKGEVVVLDFWATWCGPCLQAMPQVEKAVAAFKDRGVKLIAVNLQETPKEIAAMLERHKLDLTVALDRNGLVAEKYGANAIPQTVVIGRDGKILRLYVGGGPRLGDQLREALKAALDDKPQDVPRAAPAP